MAKALGMYKSNLLSVRRRVHGGGVH